MMEAIKKDETIQRKDAYRPFILNSMDQRSKIIGHTKLTLTITAGLLLLLVVLWPVFDEKENKLKLQFSSAPKGMETETKMVKPSFFGVDKDNQPFNVSGSSAEQLDKNTIKINDISGEIVLQDKSWLFLKANEGKIEIAKKHAELNGKVNIILNNGFEASTESADIDFKKSIAYGNTPVVFQGPPGVLTADKFKIFKNGNRIILKDNVVLTIYLENANN